MFHLSLHNMVTHALIVQVFKKKYSLTSEPVISKEKMVFNKK